MTSQQQRLEEIRQQIKDLAEQIEQLKAEEAREAKQPRDNLLGRWARHEEYGHVLIACQHADERGGLFVAYPDDGFPDGADGRYANQRELTFPEQAVRPEDVLVGDAWIVDVHNGDARQRAQAIKIDENLWVADAELIDDDYEWIDSDITLITPLIPARPHDKPETATTEDEYSALPEGTIVAMQIGGPWIREGDAWTQGDESVTAAQLSGITRHILRRGWGE